MATESERLIDAFFDGKLDSLLDADPLDVFLSLRESERKRDGRSKKAARDVVIKVCGMMLEGTNWEAPYRPLAVVEGQRTALPTDLTEGEVDFLDSLLPRLAATAVSAQIADVLLVYALGSGRGDLRYRSATRAVSTWLAMEARTPNSLTVAAWQRGAEIAKRFAMQEPSSALESIALTRISGANVVDAWRSAQALRRSGLGRERSEAVIDALTSAVLAVTEAHARREILSEIRAWHNRRGALEAAAECSEKIGDSCWSEARVREDSNMIRRDLLANAYSEYRTVARALRSSRTSKRLRKLPRLIREAGVLALDEMHAIESGPIDLQPIRDVALDVLAEEGVMNRLAKWFSPVPLDKREDVLRDAERTMREHPIQHLFARTTFDDDGRLIHRVGGIDVHGDQSQQVASEALRQFELKISILVSGYVWPVLSQTANEIRIDRDDFLVMLRSSPFVPPEQRWTYATGLVHGYQGRLIESLYLLAPTVEACVRACLQRHGVETRSVRSDNTEFEPGLSSLMALPGADEALTADVAWHIRALFCGPTGPNLRNRVAHGLLTEDSADDGHLLFAWWFCLRLAFVPYFNLNARVEDE